METMLDGIKKNAGFSIFAGILILVAGFLAMSAPFVAGLSVAVMVGIMLVVGGLTQIVFTFRTKAGFLAIVVGILAVLAGGYMLMNPGIALASLTMVLAMFLVFSGIMEIILAFQAKPAEGWGWALFSAIMTLILGIMIWRQFPLSGTFAIGILVGLKLVFSGMTLMTLGFAARAAAKSAKGTA